MMPVFYCCDKNFDLRRCAVRIKKQPNEKNVTATFSIPPRRLALARKTANQLDISFSLLVQTAIDRFIARKNKAFTRLTA